MEKIEANFKSIKEVFNILLENNEATKDNCNNILKYTFPEKTDGAIDKERLRAFNAIAIIYNLQIGNLFESDDLILKKNGYLSFNLDGYKIFLNNNIDLAKRDLVLRYQYVTAKDELIKDSLESLIVENIEGSLSIVNSFKAIEKKEVIKQINKSILEDKQLNVSTEKYNHIVNPLKIYYDNGFWYLATIKEDKRTWWININSIKSIEILESNNIYSKDILNRYKKLKFDAYGDENREREYRIVLELVDEEQFSYFKNKMYKVTQRLAPEKGMFCVEFKFNYIWEIQPLILGWLDVISIKEVEYIKNVTYADKIEKEQEFYIQITSNMNKFIDENLAENIT